MKIRAVALTLACVAGAFVCVACEGGKITHERRPTPTGGRADHGAQLVSYYGCVACHTIPGIRAARGEVGPPLAGFARRSFVAGDLPNTPDNVVRWLRDPPAIHPKTAMPALGMTPQEAKDIAAYLYTLD